MWEEYINVKEKIKVSSEVELYEDNRIIWIISLRCIYLCVWSEQRHVLESAGKKPVIDVARGSDYWWMPTNY